MDKDARMWIPIPSTDDFQTINVTNIDVPGTHQILKDDRFGNQVLFVELSPEDSGSPILLQFDVETAGKNRCTQIQPSLRHILPLRS